MSTARTLYEKTSDGQSSPRGRMKPFRVLTGVAAPLPLANIDTDMIIPGHYVTAGARPVACGRIIDRRDGPANGVDDNRSQDPGDSASQRPNGPLRRPVFCSEALVERRGRDRYDGAKRSRDRVVRGKTQGRAALALMETRIRDATWNLR